MVCEIFSCLSGSSSEAVGGASGLRMVTPNMFLLGSIKVKEEYFLY